VKTRFFTEVFQSPSSRAMTQVILTDSVVAPSSTTKDAVAAMLIRSAPINSVLTSPNWTVGDRHRGSALK
jgi:hypothetical protein